MVYLNNAATSWPKPSCVNEAVQACLMDTPASQFRGGSAILKKDVEVLCREAMGELLGIAESERIFFTSGATESFEYYPVWTRLWKSRKQHSRDTDRA